MKKIFTHAAFSAFCRQFTGPDEGEEYERLWKLRTVFDKLTEDCAKFYNSSEHMAVDKGNYKIQGQGYLQAVHSKEKKIFQHQNQGQHEMKVYLGRDPHCPTDDMTATHAVRHWTGRVATRESP
jgi:hypothetical protein